jgi:Kef-type K+ transport system membrane component KefB
VLLGNLHHLGFDAFTFMGNDAVIAAMAEVGVVVLLFEVGLESTVAQMAKVGASALLVAVLGVIAPFGLGWGVGAWLLPEHSTYVHVFLGATLTATSVGITARVLKDLGHSQSKEARVILGAAVIDDVLGLIVLAAVSGIIAAADAGQSASFGSIALITGKAVGFLGGALLIGSFLTPTFFRRAARLRGTGVLLGMSLSFCFFLSWAASVVGLAPIVGAFAAGLVLEHAHYAPFKDQGVEYELEELVRPIVSVLTPVFFVMMGFHVDLAVFADPSVFALAGALVVAAVVGKQVCMLGVLEKGIRRVPIGFGMIPRGEVGLIFAKAGLALTFAGERIVDDATYGAVVIVVIVTTLLAPPLLTWSLKGANPSPG